MKRVLLLSTGLATLAVAGLTLWPVFRVHFLDSSFGKVKTGDTRAAVESRMGRPWKDEECGSYLGGKASGCVEEFVYAHPYAPYAPEYWVIDFDASRTVINSVHLVSP